MSKRNRRARNAASDSAHRLVPKAGPGGFYVREFVSARTGREERYRNLGEHPLTLAHGRKRISDTQFEAGDAFRTLWEMRAASGHDSTDMAPGSGGSARTPFTQVQVDAIRRLDRWRARIKRRDWIILEKFCGEGWSMVEAVRAATLWHPSGVLLRVQEALDELIEAREAPRLKSA
ncbi:MAG TPA: hypothetical protein VGF97_15845 [Rhizomicrobium sp.]|jgi:hypothetical protein